MKALIDSKFIKLIGQERPVWNQRLLEPPDNLTGVDSDSEKMATLDDFRREIQKNNIRLSQSKTCPCGGGSLEKIAGRDRFGLPFSTWICQSCGLISTQPHIEQQSLSYYYQKFYHPIHFDRKYLDNESALYAKGQGEKIFNQIYPLSVGIRKMDILELGMGTGSVLSEFKHAAEKIGVAVDELGTEFNEACIRAAEKNKIRAMWGSSDEVIRQNMKFDLVILSHVFEHFVDLSSELNKLSTMLKPSGLVYVEVPGIMSLHNRSQYDFDYLKYVTHAHTYHFNLTSLAHFFNTNGFMLVCGNETVEAVFRKGVQETDLSKNYEQLISYLAFMEHSRVNFFDRNCELMIQKSRLEEHKVRMHQLDAKIQMQETQLQQLRARIKKMESTWSWKITFPLRWISSCIKNFE